MTTIDPLSAYRLRDTVAGRKELGQEDFLRLMITQFRNQDPMKPMENGEFLGQIAQFSTVSGIQQLQDSFAALSASLQSGQALQAVSLVGRSALVASDRMALPTSGAVTGAVELPAGAGSVVVEIADASGNVVRRLELGERAAGTHTFAWDGAGEDGARLAPGTYLIAAHGRLGGRTESLATRVAARIDSVALGGAGGLTLHLDAFGPVPFAAVSQFL